MMGRPAAKGEKRAGRGKASKMQVIRPSSTVENQYTGATLETAKANLEEISIVVGCWWCWLGGGWEEGKSRIGRGLWTTGRAENTDGGGIRRGLSWNLKWLGRNIEIGL